jgi:tripartite-type tricarboxylate transporter receptor subunit TctC
MSDSMKCLAGALVFAGVLLSGTVSQADNYPNKGIRVVLGQAAGGPADVRARQISQRLSAALGQQVIVENRPGAGGTLAADYVAKSAPDGYTLLYGNIGELTIAPNLYKHMSYDPLADLSPITQNSLIPPILVVSPSLGVASMKELIALAKAKPGELSAASYGNGTLTHLLILQLAREAGIEITHVPYKLMTAGQTDVIAGRVSMMFDYTISSGGFIKAGMLRPLMTVGRNRSKVLPDGPSAAEAGLPGIKHNAWTGFLAPAKTPKEIINRLNGELVRILRSPEIAQILIDSGGMPVGNSPEEFAAFMRSEQAELSELIRVTGAKVE